MRLLLPALVLLAGLAGASPAAAQQQMPDVPMDDRAVTATASSGAVTFHFSKSSASARTAYKRIAAKKVYVYCFAVARKSPNLPPVFGKQDTSAGVRASGRQAAVRVPLAGVDEYDICHLMRWSDETSIAVASVTANGRVHLEESALAGAMLYGTSSDDGRVLSTTEVVVAGDGRFVGLAAPDATPPKGKIGYWTDGTKYAVVAVTSGGRRLFWEGEGDVVRTNAFWFTG